jgi:glycosyltransferase involved in cell wall biosynthesis
MKRIALNFICKNESHVIERMLRSALSVVDVIVAVDTGSTDNTIDIIKRFGVSNNIPTIVFERLFDNFSNSRNYALNKTYLVCQELFGAINDIWGLTFDCDEILRVLEDFDKNRLSFDLYLVVVKLNEGLSVVRQALYRLSIAFRWEGPIHEILVWEKETTIRVSFMLELSIFSESKGGSWKTNLEDKFLNYARLLGDYANAGHEDFRTLFYVGASYASAGYYSKFEGKTKQHCEKAEVYFERAAGITEISSQEKVLLYNDFAKNKIILKRDWATIQPLFFLAYSNDNGKAEAIAYIIRHYMARKQWNTAYLFSYTAYMLYHGTTPSIKSMAGLNLDLYAWELLLYYYICCYYTRKFDEGKAARKQLMEFVLNHMNNFSYRQLLIIQVNSPFYLFLRASLHQLFNRH